MAVQSFEVPVSRFLKKNSISRGLSKLSIEERCKQWKSVGALSVQISVRRQIVILSTRRDNCLCRSSQEEAGLFARCPVYARSHLARSESRSARLCSRFARGLKISLFLLDLRIKSIKSSSRFFAIDLMTSLHKSTGEKGA